MSIFNLLTILIIIVAILLIGAILLQEPKERIAPSGGGAASVQRIGINQKADFLEKATWVLVGLLLFLTLLSALFLKDAPQSHRSPNLAKAQQDQALNPIAPSNTTDDAPKEDQHAPSHATNSVAKNQLAR
ncbi:preprotein translocase subunit SecG [Cardinium endosymbiont of Philonthus spinipes]|uniref:preprotein translocase subunit SecG n=1 Tax=Cardinium endosymbiont of Philonthus spinipes TaxID=3077941 RepID=UPI00313C631E